jgi:hypothetical protein
METASTSLLHELSSNGSVSLLPLSSSRRQCRNPYKTQPSSLSPLYIKQHQVPLHTSTRPNRINNRSVKPLYTMSQHGFQRQQSGNLRLQDEITQRQVWSLAIGYFAYLIVASMIFYYYSRYADEKHRCEMVEQARGKQ